MFDVHVAPSESLGIQFLRIALLVTRTGLGRATIDRLIAERKLPMPVKLARRAARMDPIEALRRELTHKWRDAPTWLAVTLAIPTSSGDWHRMQLWR